MCKFCLSYDEYAIYTGVEVSKLNVKDMDKLMKDSQGKRKEQEKNISEVYENTKKDVIFNYEKQKIIANLNN